MYNVPKSTLWDQVSNNVSVGANSGPPRYLNDVEEKEVVTFMVGLAKLALLAENNKFFLLSEQD